MRENIYCLKGIVFNTKADLEGLQAKENFPAYAHQQSEESQATHYPKSFNFMATIKSH